VKKKDFSFENIPGIHITFRVKILLSLAGTVLLFLVVLLLVVRHEISLKTQWIIQQTRERSNQAFTQLEELYHAELLRFSRRISEKNRVPAALQVAVEESDYQLLAEAAAYELNLAQIPLAVFTDDMGKPVLTLLQGNVLQEEEKTLEYLHQEMTELLQKKFPLPGKTAPSISGYHIFKGRLYTTHGLVLYLFNRPVGTVTVGFPVNNTLAERMGKVLHAEVGFVVEGKFLAVTPKLEIFGLKEQLKEAAVKERTIQVKLEGEPWIIISEPLIPVEPRRGSRVIAVSLNEYLGPLFRIDKVFRFSGIAILLVSLILGLSVSRGLAAPVQQLVAATRQVAAGRYRTRVRVKSKDEMAILAEAFNKMTQGLLLKEQYRGILDKVVSPAVAEEMIKGKITLGGENRKVTTLFADIRGFTSLTEGMEPQEVITTLNEYIKYAGSAIEAEGGVVDKYVGDAIMAIFGAPISHPDDSLRAIRAGLRIQENIQRMNYRRKVRAKTEINVGIGINTGIAVAGNMGSHKRLNYTVLGESVNIASRLCTQAGPSEVLITEQTLVDCEEHIQTHEHRTISMKGFSKPVKVFKVEKIRESLNPVLKSIAGFILFILLFLNLGNVNLKGVSTPYLSGLHLISKNGLLQLDITGRLQLSGYFPQESPAWLISETKPFASGRLSLFSDIFIGNRLYGLMELRIDRGEIPTDGKLDIRLQQAFLRYSLLENYNLHIQVGKFVSPFGGYNQRHDTVADPFIRPPLFHEYRTMICPGIAPTFNDGFIRWKKNPAFFRPTGAPIIWGVPYQAGIMVLGNFGRIGFRAAAMNSAPSSDPVQWDLDLNQDWHYSWVAHLDYRFSPEFKLGISFNYGPYSLESIKTMLPYGSNINDYPQILWGLDAVYTRGKFIIHLELLEDTWKVPNLIDDPRDFSYYLEMKYKFLPGLFIAIRYNGIHFNKLAFSNGEKEQWDFDVQRWQGAMGYRFSRRLEARVEYQVNYTEGPVDPKDNLLILQLIWKF